MKLKYSKNAEVFLKPESLEEAIKLSEASEVLNKRVSHAIHDMIVYNRSALDIEVDFLEDWGIYLDRSSIKETERYLLAKKKKYNVSSLSIPELMTTPEFTEKVKEIENNFGYLPSGKVLRSYQLNGAALVSMKKHILLGFEPGLGKTITSLVSALSAGAKKVLVITMSRNQNDWLTGAKDIGYKHDARLIKTAPEMNSDETIHITSYEAWANSYVKYRPMLLEECPKCKSIHSWDAERGYCRSCSEKIDPFVTETITTDGKTDRKVLMYSSSNKPSNCPRCSNQWKGGDRCESYNVKTRSTCGFELYSYKRKPLSYYYKEGKYDAVIVDEIQYLKNGNSARSRAVRKVKAPIRIGLSGTPAEKNLTDLYWELGWIKGFNSSYADPLKRTPFARHGQVGEGNFREYFGGGAKTRVLDSQGIQAKIGHAEELWDLLDSVLYRVTQDEVRHETAIPEPTHRRIHFDMLPAERDLYDLKLEEFREWYLEELMKKEAAEARGDDYKISMITVCSKMEQLRKVASHPWTFKDFDQSKGGNTAKLEYIWEEGRKLLRAGKKFLVFSNHKESVEDLALRLDGLYPGREAAYFHGEVKKEYRWDLIDRFQDPNDPLSILVMSVKTGAESYTLDQAKAVFLWDLDYNHAKMTQCYYRAVRGAQKDVVDVHWLLNLDTIDINIHSMILSEASGVMKGIDRQEMDLEAVARTFEGNVSKSGSVDFHQLANEVLSRGTKRAEVLSS